MIYFPSCAFYNHASFYEVVDWPELFYVETLLKTCEI